LQTPVTSFRASRKYCAFWPIVYSPTSIVELCEASFLLLYYSVESNILLSTRLIVKAYQYSRVQYVTQTSLGSVDP